MVEIIHKQIRALRPHGALIFFIPIAALCLIWLASKQVFSVVPSASSWIWIVSLGFMGMAHGSLDLHVQEWSRKGEFKANGWAKFFWYIGLMVLTFLLFCFFPLILTLAFLTLTAVHFGEADRVHAIECFGSTSYLPKSWAWTRGSFVVAIPSILHPMKTWEPFYHLSNYAYNSGVGNLISIFGYSLLIGSTIVSLVGSFDRRIKWSSPIVAAYIFESIICLLWFVYLPPLFAIGGYFLAIHSTKHMLRLSQFKMQKHNNSDILRSVLKLHVDAMWLGVPAYLVVIIWSYFLGADWTSSLAFASIGFYLISTFPHHLLVAKIPIRNFVSESSNSVLDKTIQRFSSSLMKFSINSGHDDVYSSSAPERASSSSHIE